ncbi:PREDICTED: uncharacterized protein LOC109179881 [Ipomoea nil]|uniref:uncharacterized protein LOC109179881 n=1 Tax=Ipomoea nil TaxID=35883 RepID=UPI00090091D5|nr:PREDICTED: uncharacterized protein LOC109179881 [Ipomoea nil]
METNRETTVGKNHHSSNAAGSKKPPRLSMETLRRTISDMSFELTSPEPPAAAGTLPPIPEVAEEAKCECCGMSEECTAEYVRRVRERFAGKMVCGLCSEAVKEEMEKNGGKREEAVQEHMNACVRFNRVGRAFPVLCQAKAMRELLKNSRGKSLSPRDPKSHKGGIARSSSCIPAIIAKDYLQN